MVRTCCIVILIFLFKGDGWSQTKSLVIAGVVKDSVVNQTVKDARVYLENKEENFVLTNRYGKFYLRLDAEPGKEYSLVVRDVRFDILKKPITRSMIRRSEGDTLHMELFLSYRMLSPFEVMGTPDTVFGSKEVSVSDFDFIGDNRYLLLVYEKRLQKGSKVLLTDYSQQTLSTFTVPDEAKEFYSDYLNRKYLICTKRVYQITTEDDVLSLLPLEHDFFERQIRPWVDTTEDGAYMSNFVWYYPEMDYYFYSMRDSSWKNIHHVVDKPLLELYRAQYKYVDGKDKLEAFRAELATGIDKEIRIAIWSGFPSSIYYHQLYAPLFVKEDTLLIFDHYKNRLFRYNRKGEAIDSLEISYHNSSDRKSWEELLLKDQETQVIYSVYLRDGKYVLKELNTATGEVTNAYRLYYKYPERLKIRGDHAYYIYRPYESAQKKFLYKEKIR